MSPSDTLFFAEMYSLVKKMEETIDEFEMKDRVLASIIVGVLDLEAIEYGDEEAEMKTIMDNAYSDEDEDLEDLLGSLGISLN